MIVTGKLCYLTKCCGQTKYCSLAIRANSAKKVVIVLLFSMEQLLELKYELRQTIRRQLWRRSWKNSDLAAKANLYPSDLSNFMNIHGTRTFPIEALDSITEALGLPVGELYPLYFGECLSKGKIIKHRCEEFLYRCIVQNFHQISEQLLSALLTENKSNVDVIFTVVKKLFEERFEAALPLIDTIIEHDPHRSAQRLATCYFYRFFIVRDKGMEQGYQALVQMLEFLVFMPVEIQMEAYLRIITFFNAKEDWEFVREYGKKLEELAGTGKYYGEALLYQSFAAREMGKFEEALELTEKYAKVSDYYADLAEGNRLYIFIHSGKAEYIDQLISFKKKRSGAFVAIPTFVEGYVKAGQFEKIQPTLEDFSEDLKILKEAKNPFVANLLLRFRYFYAIYQFMTGNYEEGMKETFEAAKLASQLENRERLKDCLLLYHEYNDTISTDEKMYFQQQFEQIAITNNIILRTNRGM